MIFSMTGFGKSEVERDGSQVAVELKSVNGRFCDVTVHAPKWLSELEPKVKKLVQGRVSRGRVNVSITWEEAEGSEKDLSVDLNLARIYSDNLIQLKESLGIEGQVDLSLLSGLPDIFEVQMAKPDIDYAWSLVEEALKLALDQHGEMRRAEGAELYRDFLARIDLLEKTLEEIESLAPLRVELAREKLKERIEKVLLPGEVDESRLAMEIAIFAEKSDITEECVRFHSHNRQFLDALEEEEPVGRRLNFLLQEMGREANTIGAKANDATISHLVVRIKEELEKLREQVQNVE